MHILYGIYSLGAMVSNITRLTGICYCVTRDWFLKYMYTMYNIADYIMQYDYKTIISNYWCLSFLLLVWPLHVTSVKVTNNVNIVIVFVHNWKVLIQQRTDQSVGQKIHVPVQYLDIPLVPGQYLDIAWLKRNIFYIALGVCKYVHKVEINNLFKQTAVTCFQFK